MEAGDVLFKEGDRGFSFYVILNGAVEIVEQSHGTPHQVTVHHPGEFTGDVDMLSGRVVLVTGRATVRGDVLELTAAALRQAVDALPEIGEIVLKAFLTQRTLLCAIQTLSGEEQVMTWKTEAEQILSGDSA